LPHDVLVILVRRAGTDLVPRGNTTLERGDRLLLFGTFDAVTEARQDLVAIE
jgi:Trk K+ transport system NAD-binding subunit